MKTITISPKISDNNLIYPIYIGTGIISKVIDFDAYSKLVILTDTNIEKLWLQPLLKALPNNPEVFILKPGEKEKNLESVQKIWEKLYKYKCDRKSLLINLGGGVICDMGGFAASTYMRGISFINIPTTILSQVDASVGGKTGFDFINIKNLIGTFTQPDAVIIDSETLKTLPERLLNEGFAEIIKHGLIKDKNYFVKVTSKKPQEFNQKELTDIIAGSCEIKAAVVTADLKEQGSRKIVNFGHTIGHAIESIVLETNKPLLHGEAVSIGMVAAAKISELMGYLNTKDVEKIKDVLQNAGLPITVHKLEKSLIKKRMAGDKKKQFGKIKWTLLKDIGEAIYDVEVPEKIVELGIKYIQQ